MGTLTARSPHFGPNKRPRRRDAVNDNDNAIWPGSPRGQAGAVQAKLYSGVVRTVRAGPAWRRHGNGHDGGRGLGLRLGVGYCPPVAASPATRRDTDARN